MRGAIVLLALAVLAAGWWGVRTFRDARRRAAVSALQPVASSAPADQPQKREALELADRLLRDFPDSPEALYVRGLLLYRYGCNDEAVKTWNACLELVPDLAFVYEALGIDASRRGEEQRAVELLRKAVELDPGSPRAGLELGKALISLGTVEEAVPALEQYLETSPHSVEARFQLGQAHLYLKSYKEAKRCYEAALNEAPSLAQAYYGLALACGRLGETDKAREYRQKHDALRTDRRAAAQQQARQASRDEAEVRESMARAYATAARVYAAQGRIQDAQECWGRAAAYSPETVR